MGDGHYRHNRRSRNLIKTLRQTRSNAVRLKILEELAREFEKMKESRLGRALKRGAIGTASWGRRAGAKTARRVSRTAGTVRMRVGTYAREQAKERARTAPERKKAQNAKRAARARLRAAKAKQRATRRAKSKQGVGNGLRARVNFQRQLRRTPDRAGKTSGRAAPPAKPGPARQPRPAQDARAARATNKGSRSTPSRTAGTGSRAGNGGGRAPRGGGSKTKAS